MRGGSERSGGPSRRRGNQGDERGGCASRHGHRGARERGEGAASEADDDGERGGEGGEPAGHRGKFRVGHAGPARRSDVRARPRHHDPLHPVQRRHTGCRHRPRAPRVVGWTIAQEPRGD